MRQKPRGRRPVQEITVPQRRTLKEIRRFLHQRGFPPTIKELADILGISHASAYEQMNQFVRKGCLKHEPEHNVPDLVAVPTIGKHIAVRWPT